MINTNKNICIIYVNTCKYIMIYAIQTITRKRIQTIIIMRKRKCFGKEEVDDSVLVNRKWEIISRWILNIYSKQVLCSQRKCVTLTLLSSTVSQCFRFLRFIPQKKTISPTAVWPGYHSCRQRSRNIERRSFTKMWVTKDMYPVLLWAYSCCKT